MNRIKDIRIAAGLSLRELANPAGISAPYLLDLENGRRGARPETWQRLADALGVKVEDLRDDKPADNPGGG